MREVREETGYESVCGPLLGIRHHIVPVERRMHATGRPMKAVQVVFRVEITGGALRNELDGSTDEAAWVPLAELKHVATDCSCRSPSPGPACPSADEPVPRRASAFGDPQRRHSSMTLSTLPDGSVNHAMSGPPCRFTPRSSVTPS